MKGIFCSTTANTNEEYREVIKKRMRFMAGITVVGILTAFSGFFAEYFQVIPLNEHILELYSGFGTGLAVACGMIWVKHKLLLGNEEKLKESRLNNSDERLIEIGNRALRTAGLVLLVGLYTVGLIGGIFDPVLLKVVLFLVLLYVFAYAGAYFYYKKKM